jgi:hypothetical protein
MSVTPVAGTVLFQSREGMVLIPFTGKQLWPL